MIQKSITFIFFILPILYIKSQQLYFHTIIKQNYNDYKFPKIIYKNDT